MTSRSHGTSGEIGSLVITTHERRELTLNVPLGPADQWEQVKEFTAKTKFRVERLRVQVVAMDGVVNHADRLNRAVKVTYCGPRLIKSGDSQEVVSDDHWNNDLSRLTPATRDLIESILAGWEARL